MIRCPFDTGLIVIGDGIVRLVGVILRAVFCRRDQAIIPVIGIDRGRVIAVIGDLVEPARRVVFVGIDNNKRTVYTYIIAYFRNSVKSIVGIFYHQPVTVGERVELAVARVVGVGRQRAVVGGDSRGVSKRVVGEGIGGGLGGNARQPLCIFDNALFSILET